MNIVICDDEKQFLYSIKVKINSWAEKTGNTSGLMLHCFTSSEDVLDSWQHGLQIDALFMDIQIPGELNGLAALDTPYSAVVTGVTFVESPACL